MHRSTVRCPARSGEGFSPLEELDRAFLSLAVGSCPLTLPLPAGMHGSEGDFGRLPVDQARAALAHPATTQEARTQVWRGVVSRAQADGEPWSTVAVGMAVPVLRRILSRPARGGVVEAVELEQEVLAAFVAALGAADPDGPPVDRELFAAADRAAHRHVYAAHRHARIAAVRRGADLSAWPAAPEALVGAGDEYEVLARAVQAGVVTCREAQVIGRSRLEGESMTTLAFERRMSRRHLYRYRADAESRLAAFLKDSSAC